MVERQDQTRMALANATHHVPELRKIFHQEGVPTDLIWLAFIESSFQAHARNPSGAVGMFQFKDVTARAFGLEVSNRRDDRLVPTRAARASARYLKYLWNKFKDWDLVLAAYNLGEGDLRRAMQRRKVETWLQIKPFVREETQNYVGKVKAAALIGNAHLHNTRDTPPPRRHLVQRGETLWRIAKRYNVDLEQLRDINGLWDNHIEVGQALLIPPS